MTFFYPKLTFASQPRSSAEAAHGMETSHLSSNINYCRKKGAQPYSCKTERKDNPAPSIDIPVCQAEATFPSLQLPAQAPRGADLVMTADTSWVPQGGHGRMSSFKAHGAAEPRSCHLVPGSNPKLQPQEVLRSRNS